MQSFYQLANLGGFSQFIIGILLYVGPFLLIVWLWKRLKVKPNGLTIYCGFIWLALGVIASVLPDLTNIWWWSLIAWAVLLLVDFLVLVSTKSPQVSRTLPGRFAIEIESEVVLKLTNCSQLPLTVSVYDGLAEEHESDGLPWQGELPANGFAVEDAGYQAPAEDGSRVEIVVKPGSERLQLLAPFKAWDGNNLTGLRLLI